MSEFYAITSLISIALLVIWIFSLFPDYQTDAFRQKMFKLRDDLFDDAANGKISFDDPAYGMLRGAMNGFIRFGHRLNIWQVLLFELLIDRDDGKLTHPFDKEFDRNIERCTDEQKEIFKSYYIKMNLYIIEHLIFSSVLLLCLIVPVVFLYIAKMHIAWLTDILKNQFDKLNTLALTTGKAQYE